LNSWISQIEGAGAAAPWLFVAVFVAASVMMIWRLEAMSADGFEGTVLGTLIMPYCSGIGNLIFAFLLARQGGRGGEVLTNSIVNNVTNLTLLIGLPAILWVMKATPVSGDKPKKRSGGGNQHRVHKLSLLLTLTAALFFIGAAWLLGRDGSLNATDGWVLIGIFLFWQSFHVFEVLKSNARQNKSLGWMLPVNLVLLGLGAYATYVSIDWLVAWLSHRDAGFISARNLGWLSGWLMVLPNAILALYYGWRRKPEVVYSSQVGDGHICIPLCIGLFAVQRTIAVPAVFEPGIYILAGAVALHMLFVMLFGHLPRFMGILLVLAYGVFVYRGVGN